MSTGVKENFDVHSPTFFGPITLSDTDNLNPSIRGIIVDAAGTVSVTDITNKTRTLTFIATHLPVTIKLQIKRINTTGTTVPVGNIHGLR